ncbi:DUF4421 family protein [Aestuariibaculum sediminum]|uniref:DUF4421 family protein n=1 Tax=Aestuariibaculum sediminum TaxID=2770637 RepID=A0A8J6Q733_9FLAO|nr:DUF4421 family protein [Aestuariibaculum sediminum]MBD0831365.1 DUF4421 family protein [Aestuariibaculum sediminum]
MGLRELFRLTLIVINTIPLLAQNHLDSNTVRTSNYKKDYPNVVTVRAYYINTSNTLRIKDRNSNLAFDLEPNKQDRIGASVAFRGLTASYAFAPNFLGENKDNKNSKLFNLNFRTFFGKHLMQTFDLFGQKGFNVKNNEINSYFPQIKNFKIGGSTSYIFNENFSFRAISSQDEKQLKSTGSFIPNLTYYYTKLHIKNNGDNPDVNSSYYSFDMAFAPSYFYNFVPSKNLLFSVGLAAGIGLNRSKSKGEEYLTTLLTELSFSGSATYDINKLYCGLHYNYLNLNHNADSVSEVVDNIPFFNIFIGYRFKAPDKVINIADAINKKLMIN